MTAGWLLIGGFLLVAASVIGLFPKSLPRAAARRVLAAERRSAGLSTKDDENKIDDDLPTSFAGTLPPVCSCRVLHQWVSGDLHIILKNMVWLERVAPNQQPSSYGRVARVRYPTLDVGQPTYRQGIGN